VLVAPRGPAIRRSRLERYFNWMAVGKDLPPVAV
jgi:hypothetical protein